MSHPIAAGQPGLAEVEGRNRCREVDLAVVDDLSRLCDCPDPSSLLHVIGIIGRGVPVITGSSWVLAKGHLDLVPKESVVRHQRLVAKKKVVFEYNLHFKVREEFLLAGLVWLSKQSNATWKVRDSSVSAVAESGYEVVKLLASDGVETLRLWIGKQRRIVNTSGSKAWSLYIFFLRYGICLQANR